MSSFDPRRILSGVNFPDWKKSWRRTVRFIGAHEKVLLAILAIVIVISGGFWYRQFSNSNSDSPTVGGTYVEGMVSDKKELSQITTRLTKTGLLTFSSDGQLEGQLAQEWTMSEDRSEFRFTLADGVDRNDIISVLGQRSDVIGEADIQPDQENDVVIKLASPNPSFPLLITRPLFDYGPYKLGKSNDQTTVFTRNTKKKAVSSYINKIIIHSYATDADLEKALQGNRLDGAVMTKNTKKPKNYQHHEINLNRYYVVLFNTNKAPFRDDGLRKALAAGTAAQATPFTLIAGDQEPYKSLATDIVAKWQQLGAKVELSLKPLQEVTGSIGPSRNFQALLIGIDYGLEMDPYYLWHSSQIRATGNNVTGTNNPTVDGLVEKTRNNLNVVERQESLDELQNTLVSQGVMTIVQRMTLDYYISNNIQFVQPSLPSSDADRFLSAALWSVK
ncbi:MAG: ABC transporter substrate-binding protein [Candidatus Berkelbacteria bacterium]|nr:ABC transporter substrate-binding protein [Candidatus Berkelbacteria bacterium]MCR4306984.1 ABC transporter substrate-binding protein [Candidatus Berkelbacteria bacterium]